MNTSSGQKFVSQFLKDGESIKVISANGVREYDFKGSGDGRFSNSTFEIVGKNIPGALGRAYTMHKNADGTRGSLLLESDQIFKESDFGKLQKNQSFIISAALNSEKELSSDEWAEVIGHEVFQHLVDDANAVDEVISQLKSGKYKDLNELIMILRKAASSADDDHERANSGDDEDYNQYINELDQ